MYKSCTFITVTTIIEITKVENLLIYKGIFAKKKVCSKPSTLKTKLNPGVFLIGLQRVISCLYRAGDGSCFLSKFALVYTALCQSCVRLCQGDSINSD